MMQKVSTCLWFDGQAQEAMKFYTSVFKNSKAQDLGSVQNGPDTDEQISLVRFQLENMEFMALDGGPQFKFNESVSFMVDCEDQAEVDYYWEKLSAVPESEQCGWLKDKFGVSWQIVPKRFGELMSDPDPEVKQRVTDAMLKMKKLDIAELEAAAKG